MSELVRIADEIIESANIKMVELGVEAAERIVSGKEGIRQFRQGERIRVVKRAYDSNVELTEKEKESLLHCLRQLSEQYMVATISPVFTYNPTAVDVGLYFGAGDDIEEFIGERHDISHYL